MRDIIVKLKAIIKPYIIACGCQPVKGTLTFYYLRRKSLSHVNHATQGKYIELFGPSGVGKTTLLKSLKRKVIDAWLLNEDLAALKPKYTDIISRPTAHWAMLEKQYSIISKKGMSDYQKTKLLHYYSKVAVLDQLAFDPTLPKGVLLDEGLCLNFTQQLLDMSNESFGAIMKGRALVYLAPKNVNTAVNQIRKRALQKDGCIHLIYDGLKDDELCEKARSFMEDYLTPLSQRAETHGIKVCRLFAEDGLNYNARILTDFINSVITNK